MYKYSDKKSERELVTVSECIHICTCMCWKSRCLLEMSQECLKVLEIITISSPYQEDKKKLFQVSEWKNIVYGGDRSTASTSSILFEVFNHFCVSFLNYSQCFLQCQQPEWTLPFIPSASSGHFPSLLKTFCKFQWCCSSTAGNSWYWCPASKDRAQDGTLIPALQLLWMSTFCVIRLLHSELYLKTVAWPSGEAESCHETMLTSGKWDELYGKKRKKDLFSSQSTLSQM